MLKNIKAIFSLMVLFTLSFPALSLADDAVGRSIIPSCQALIVYEQQTSPVATDLSEPSWNKHYRDGHSAIRNGDFSQAEQQMCLALFQAQNFAERDWRFAETLDELGLIYFMRGQFDESIKAQGAAVAELLLAAGPTTIRQTRTRKVSMFVERLGRVYAKQGRSDLAEKLKNNPYKIYEMEYIPQNTDLAKRLGWLVSEYLGLENLTASNYLLKLIDVIDER